MNSPCVRQTVNAGADRTKQPAGSGVVIDVGVRARVVRIASIGIGSDREPGAQNPVQGHVIDASGVLRIWFRMPVTVWLLPSRVKCSTEMSEQTCDDPQGVASPN